MLSRQLYHPEKKFLNSNPDSGIEFQRHFHFSSEWATTQFDTGICLYIYILYIKNMFLMEDVSSNHCMYEVFFKRILNKLIDRTKKNPHVINP